MKKLFYVFDLRVYNYCVAISSEFFIKDDTRQQKIFYVKNTILKKGKSFN